MVEAVDSFSCKIPAKWVLAGEHSVLKGIPAITLPQNEFSLSLKWIPNNENQFFIFPETQKNLLLKLIENLKKIIPSEYQWHDFSGALYLENTIPLQAGLGSSAALSVGLVKFMTRHLELVKDEYLKKQKLKWASELEDFFHGKSSGMDVAAVFCGSPLVFKKSLGFQKIDLPALPKFTFHNTGETASTQKCVEMVLSYEEKNPEFSLEIHSKMKKASECAQKGLEFFGSGRQKEGEDFIAEAMNYSLECFYSWGLITDNIDQKIKELRELGPLALKLTGAGMGGFLVALWRQ